MSVDPSRLALLPAGVVLPYYARLDRAYTGQLPFKVVQPNVSYSFTAGGETIILPTVIQWLYVADGTAGVRTLRITLVDSDNHVVYAIASPFQPDATMSVRTTWTNQVSSTSIVSVAAPNTNYALAPLPPIAITAGWKLTVDCVNYNGPADLAQSPVASAVFIPTGPEEAPLAPPAAPRLL